MEIQHIGYKLVEIIKGRRLFTLNVSRNDQRCVGSETINWLSINSNHRGLVIFDQSTGWDTEAIRRLPAEWKSALRYALHTYFSKYTADNVNPADLHPVKNS